MNWKSFSSRLLLVVVAFPVLGVLIFLAPGLHLLPYTIAVVAASVVGALETRGLFRARGITTTPYLAPFLAGTLPLSVWLEVTGMIPSGWARAWLVACIGVILVRATLQKDARRIEEFLSFTSSSVFILLYPSYFLSWVVRFTALPQPSLSILLFLGLVFGNDMAAYFAGSLWGGSTQLNLAISPQKSVVGF
ncbi:MAG: phosphatidate cytidylyltransferase, partial [Spirochaetia bacterium]